MSNKKNEKGFYINVALIVIVIVIKVIVDKKKGKKEE